MFPEAEAVRRDPLEAVADMIRARGIDFAGSVVPLHLYRTLHLGVLAYGSRDNAPHQQDTLVVLGQSLRLFAPSLTGGAPPQEALKDLFETLSRRPVPTDRLTNGHRVAVKIQSPNITRAIHDDCRNLGALFLPVRFTPDWRKLVE